MNDRKTAYNTDFSYAQIPRVYPDASSDPLNSHSPLIFLVGNVAHNQMNFGNFIFGASGQAMGFTQIELRAGAHYNSLTAPESNGYERQWDSSDDQFSIKQGFQFGNQQNYDKMEYKVEVGPISPGTVVP